MCSGPASMHGSGQVLCRCQDVRPIFPLLLFQANEQHDLGRVNTQGRVNFV